MNGTIVYQGGDESLATRRQEFRQLLADIGHYLHGYAATDKDKSVCQELMRGRSLSINGLETLCELAAKSDKPFVLEDGIRGAVLQRVAAPASLSPVDTFIDETKAQAAGDIAQTSFVVERTPTRRDQALDALGRHKAAIERAMKSLWLWPRRGQPA